MKGSGATVWLIHHGGLVTVVGMLGVLVLLARWRPGPVEAAVLIWLAVYVFGVNFAFQYLPWGLPFFLIAGHTKAVALLEAVVLAPTIFYYSHPHITHVSALYAVLMIAVWVGFTVALARQVMRLSRQERLPWRTPPA